MNLNQTILDAARDEVARTTETESEIEFEMEVARKAMEKQASFFLWLILQVDSIDCEFDIIHQDGNFFRIERDESGQPIMHPNKITELELYEIWEGQKK